MPQRQPHILLASASPRRRELLGRLPVTFTVKPTDVDEDGLTASYSGAPEELALHLARHKAVAAAQWADATVDVVLTADTTVSLDGVFLGKPRDAADAWSMLRQLRDRTHIVATGIVLLVPITGEQRTCLRQTPVTMRDYSDEEIAAYIATGDPFDKAGSYAIQHAVFQPVARIAGCATNVIGLPICIIATLLHELALLPAQPTPSPTNCPWDTRCQRQQ